MGEVGDVETSALFAEPLPFHDEIAPSANYSTSTENSSVIATKSASVVVVELTTSSLFNPCADAVSDYVCINYPQLAIICIACFTVLFMIFLRLIFCCCQRRRHQKRIPDILVVEGEVIRTRLNSVSNIAPPRYSQIFDQDGISVFEEAPPEYETTQPDLLKSLPQNLSRTSSLASKGQSIETSTEDSPSAVIEVTEATGKQKPKLSSAAPSRLSTGPVVPLSVERLFLDSVQEVSC